MALTIKHLEPTSTLEHALLRWSTNLEDMGRQVFSLKDPRDGIRFLLKGIGDSLGADRVVLFARSRQGHPTPVMESLRHPGLRTMLGQVQFPQVQPFVDHGGVIISSDGLAGHELEDETAGIRLTAKESQLLAEYIADYDIKTSMVIPLSHNDSIYGYLAVHDCRPGIERTAKDLILLRIMRTVFGGYLCYHTMFDNLRGALSETLTRFGELGKQFDVSTEAMRGILLHDSVWEAEDRVAREWPDLSRRERDILVRLDRPNKAIAEELGLSESTVKGHVGGTLRKLGNLNRQQAIRKLRSLGT